MQARVVTKQIFDPRRDVENTFFSAKAREGSRRTLFDPRRATENISLSAEDAEKPISFIREVTRRAAKNSKGGPGFLRMTAWFCAD